MQFREAFSCFVFSEEEPKGIDCVEKFKAMQDCFRENPDVYGEGTSRSFVWSQLGLFVLIFKHYFRIEIMNDDDDDDDEEALAGSTTVGDTAPASPSPPAESTPVQVSSAPP